MFLGHVYPNVAMEPLALLATQPVWQAGQPVSVNVDYDVPAFGTMDEIADLQDASAMEYKVAKRRKLLLGALGAKAVQESSVGQP